MADLKLQTSSVLSGLPGGAATNTASADCLHQSHHQHNVVTVQYTELQPTVA